MDLRPLFCWYYFRIKNSEIIPFDLSRFARRRKRRQPQNMAHGSEVILFIISPEETGCQIILWRKWSKRTNPQREKLQVSMEKYKSQEKERKTAEKFAGWSREILFKNTKTLAIIRLGNGQSDKPGRVRPE